jgi:LPS O-antigen subunit length determinant protein (WzzB/FepE family)
MSEIIRVNDDEIDLIGLFNTLWEGKWKIIGATIFSAISVFGVKIVLPPPGFEALTEIKPINTVEAERYTELNSLEIYTISADKLLSLFIEALENDLLLEDAIRTNQIFDIKDFEDEEAYGNAISEFASSIELIAPTNDGSSQDIPSTYWVLRGSYNDKNKWLQFLSSVKSAANESVKLSLQYQFRTKISSVRLNRDFELEDLQIRIENALSDYDRSVSDRLAFLKEQASIARKLEVPKNTIESQMFDSQNGMIANISTDTPFYLRGYEAIEKEIELLNTRVQKEAFVQGLLELEQSQRSLMQNKSLERAEALFAETPANLSDFSAVTFNPSSTEFNDQSKFTLMLALAAVLGFMVGSVYVLITKHLRDYQGKMANLKS